jgi:hypothetical protein
MPRPHTPSPLARIGASAVDLLVVGGGITGACVALDAAPLTPAMHDAIVNEACDGFRRHIRLFESLAPTLDASTQDAADSSSAA